MPKRHSKFQNLLQNMQKNIDFSLKISEEQTIKWAWYLQNSNVIKEITVRTVKGNGTLSVGRCGIIFSCNLYPCKCVRMYLHDLMCIFKINGRLNGVYMLLFCNLLINTGLLTCLKSHIYFCLFFCWAFKCLTIFFFFIFLEFRCYS